MGNVWCCRPNSYIIDYTHRKVVISQGVQCNLLIPSSSCPQIFVPKPTCSPERHCRCGVYPTESGDWQVGNSRTDGNNIDFVNSPQMTLKSKLRNPHINYIQDHPDALVSLSETFSESSLEEFLSRKRLSQNQNPNSKDLVNKLNGFRGNELSKNSSFPEPLISVTEFSTNSKPTFVGKNMKNNYRKNRPKKRRYIVHKTHLDTSSVNSQSTENSVINGQIQELKFKTHKTDLNNSAESTSMEDSKKISETPKKSILKNCDSIKEVSNETPNSKDIHNSCSSIPMQREKSVNLSLHSEKYSNSSLPNRSLSAMSNHDSLEQLMSLLKSSTFTGNEDGDIRSKKSKSNDCINKSVNFKSVTDRKPYSEFHQKPETKSGYQIQSDGKIKKRLILRETHKLFDILNDPNDRRIRAICDRYQCDLEIFVRPPKIGLMYFAIEILAPDKYALRMCVRELDSSMKWCISSQLF